MAENFTTYTEADALNRMTETAARVTWTDMLAGDDAHYLYYDFGVDFFSGNLIQFLTISQTASEQGGSYSTFWAMTNDLDDIRGLLGGSKSSLNVYCIHPQTPNTVVLHLMEIDGASNYVETGGNGYTIADGNVYYLKIVRDESVGTYGTFYCYIYSNAARTTPLETLSITLHSSKKDYRYIMPCVSRDETAGTSKKASGYTEDLTIETWEDDFSVNAPSVTTQAVTDIATTTATGNGNVTNLGNPKATQYGHCWAEHPDPRTVHSTTEGGAPVPMGPFASSITELKQNTHYYMRAYITNPLGTFYGALVQFTTSPSTPIVTTDLVTDIGAVTALGNGSIDNDGGSAVTQHGVTWNTGGTPNIEDDSKTEEGATTLIGDFSSLMTGLLASTTYKVRAYATNDAGTGYGVEITFISNAVGAPIVTTEEATNVSGTTALGNGTIVSEGASAVTEHGHCWSTSVSPTTSNSKTTNGAASIGAFTSIITGLGAATQYYIRAYATNGEGTAYGNNVIIREIAGELRGEITVLKEHIAYTSRSGKQRALLGAEF